LLVRVIGLSQHTNCSACSTNDAIEAASSKENTQR
jgi:hypothetical protein